MRRVHLALAVWYGLTSANVALAGPLLAAPSLAPLKAGGSFPCADHQCGCPVTPRVAQLARRPGPSPGNRSAISQGRTAEQRHLHCCCHGQAPATPSLSALECAGHHPSHGLAAWQLDPHLPVVEGAALAEARAASFPAHHARVPRSAFEDPPDKVPILLA